MPKALLVLMTSLLMENKSLINTNYIFKKENCIKRWRIDIYYIKDDIMGAPVVN